MRHKYGALSKQSAEASQNKLTMMNIIPAKTMNVPQSPKYRLQRGNSHEQGGRHKRQRGGRVS